MACLRTVHTGVGPNSVHICHHAAYSGFSCRSPFLRVTSTLPQYHAELWDSRSTGLL